MDLTLTAEWTSYRWGPVESKDRVPTLLDPSGNLWPDVEPAVILLMGLVVGFVAIALVSAMYGIFRQARL